MSVMKLLVAGVGFAGLVSLTASVATSEPAGLDGTWIGGGTVTFASGAEKASCRATYSRAGAGYAMNGVCATPSGRAAQTATLRRGTANRFEGRFHNKDYDISGRIFVVFNGDSQSVRLSISRAAANILLRWRCSV